MAFDWNVWIYKLREQKIVYKWAWPLRTYDCKYIDYTKSRPYVDERGALQNINSLPFWLPEKRYLLDENDLEKALQKMELDEYVIKCKVCGLELATYYVEKGKSGIKDGIVGLKYTQHLLAYRPRADGLLGIECICGYSDTRLSVSDVEKNPDMFPKKAIKTDSEEADFSEDKSNLIAIKKEIIK